MNIQQRTVLDVLLDYILDVGHKLEVTPLYMFIGARCTAF